MRSRGKVLKGKDGERLTSHFEVNAECDWRNQFLKSSVPLLVFLFELSLNCQGFYCDDLSFFMGLRRCDMIRFYRLALSLCSREVAVLCNGCEFCHTPQKPPHSHSALQLQILWDWGSRWWVFSEVIWGCVRRDVVICVHHPSRSPSFSQAQSSGGLVEERISLLFTLIWKMPPISTRLWSKHVTSTILNFTQTSKSGRNLITILSVWIGCVPAVMGVCVCVC